MAIRQRVADYDSLRRVAYRLAPRWLRTRSGMDNFAETQICVVGGVGRAKEQTELACRFI